MLKEQRCLVLDPGGLRLITGVGSCESYHRRMVQGDRLSGQGAGRQAEHERGRLRALETVAPRRETRTGALLARV